MPTARTLVRSRYAKVNGIRVEVYEDPEGQEWVKQFDTYANKDIFVTIRAARAMRANTAQYPLSEKTEEILQQRFFDERFPHVLQSVKDKKENIRALLRAVVLGLLDVPNPIPQPEEGYRDVA